MARKPIPWATQRLFNAAVSSLTSLLPPGWSLDVVARSSTGGVLQLSASGDFTGKVSILVRDRLTPRETALLPVPEESTIVAASWLSLRTRELLANAGFGYIDQTGNSSVVMARPGLFVRTEGASRDPSPKSMQGPNIRGPRAWALLRTLAEVQPPYGLGDLAEVTDTDPRLRLPVAGRAWRRDAYHPSPAGTRRTCRVEGRLTPNGHQLLAARL